MSNTSSLAKHAPVMHSGHAETQIRPKVMRRPSHFSAQTPSAPAAAPVSAPASAAPSPAAISPMEEKLPVSLTPPAVSESTHISRAWQDDARFGLAMLLIIVALNTALILWLPHLHTAPAATVADQEVTDVIDEESPARAPSGVTLYTKPEPLLPAFDDDVLTPERDHAPVHILGAESAH